MVRKLRGTQLDREVYSVIHGHDPKTISLDEIFRQFIDYVSNKNPESIEDNIRRSLEFLKAEGVVSESVSKQETSDGLTDDGKGALENKLIEEQFCDEIIVKNITVQELKNIVIKGLSSDLISLAFGIAKKKGMISIENGIIKVNPDYKQITSKLYEFLQEVSVKKANLENSIMRELLDRKLIAKKQISFKSYSCTAEVTFDVADEGELCLTLDMLKSKSYSGKKFKEFDVEKLPKPAPIGRMHPLREIINTIKTAYLEMGFQEMRGSYVETAFWPMDSMFISQDHPMRDIQDTFYLPLSGKLPPKALIKKISAVHSNGGKTGSFGHRYNWDPKIASQLVLRPHTTAVTYRMLYNLDKNKKKQGKYFCVGKVFRNETVDSSHLPEFHQAEGFVIGKNIGLAELMGFIKDFSARLGLEKIRFKPTFNPYTEPSVEAFAYYEKEKKWMEFINAGIFRREALEPYGIKNNVIAWGLGIERVVMLIYQKNIKEVYGDECNFDWLRSYKIPSRRL